MKLGKPENRQNPEKSNSSGLSGPQWNYPASIVKPNSIYDQGNYLQILWQNTFIFYFMFDIKLL